MALILKIYQNTPLKKETSISVGFSEVFILVRGSSRATPQDQHPNIRWETVPSRSAFASSKRKRLIF